MRFKYWLENVFWYHMKWYWLVGVAAAAFAIAMIAGNIGTPHYDWNIPFVRGASAVFSSRAYVNAEISGYFEEILPDTDGNRRVSVQVTPISTTASALWGARSAQSGAENAFFAFSDPDCFIVLMDKENYERWDALGYIVDSRYSERLGQYVAVIDTPVTLTDRASAKAIGMNAEQILDNDRLLLENHARLLELALAALERVK